MTMDLLNMNAEDNVLEIKDLYDLYIETNRALQAIEAASYFVDNGISDWENAGRKELITFVNDAYAIAHSALAEHCCYDSHKNWRKITDTILKAAEKAGFSNYKKPFEKEQK